MENIDSLSKETGCWNGAERSGGKKIRDMAW